MAMVAGKCPRCNNIVQVENTNKFGFCAVCGSKIVVTQAVQLYQQEQVQTNAANKVDEARKQLKQEDTFAEALSAMSQNRFGLAESLYGDILTTDPNNVQAKWGAILAKTQNLQPKAISAPEDYAYTAANALFASSLPGIDPVWKDLYWDAFEISCRMTVEAVDPRVFLELKIYQWYANSKTFLYPISKDFDIKLILDKELWAEWKTLYEVLPSERQKAFQELCEGCYSRIREYFRSGFSNMTELQNGDLSRLMGTWRLKHTTGAQKSEVLRFSQNTVGVPYLEAYRTTVNNYDYYRFIKVDPSNRIIAGEYRHFPSVSGLGGDFCTLGKDNPILGLMAVYEYILILPTALYTRTDPAKIPNHAKASAYIDECRAKPCFQRGENLKNVYQMHPINENHDTGNPSKKMRSCYVATAVYGDAHAPQVDRLRRFRDEKLNTGRIGRRVCSVYYSLSPFLAKRLSPSGLLSRSIRRLLDAFIRRLGD
jgi:uncharacterized Zn finger protein (UPF0148 family)